MLSREEEQRVARAAQAGDAEALRRLITANLRFVQKVAFRYIGYGMNFNDLVQEGNIGLCQAAQKFDPERGFRLISYAIWYIDSAIRAYVLRNWSLVRIGTTSRQRKQFFGLRAAYAAALQRVGSHEAALALLEETFGTPDEIEAMAVRLAVRDASLQTAIHVNEQDEEGLDGLPHSEQLPDTTPPMDEAFAAAERQANLQRCIKEALRDLTSRHRKIYKLRMGAEEPLTLTAVGDKLGISRERVRQLELEVRSCVEGALRAGRERGLF